MDREKNGQTKKQTDTQTDTQTDRQTGNEKKWNFESVRDGLTDRHQTGEVKVRDSGRQELTIFRDRRRNRREDLRAEESKVEEETQFLKSLSNKELRRRNESQDVEFVEEGV